MREVLIMETRAYRSKIGRLPFALRNELNERLRDGETGESILTWLNSSPQYNEIRADFGDADINAQNLSDWRQSGYADWLEDQTNTARLRQLAELSQSMITACGGDPAAVGSRLLAAKLLDLLDRAGGDEAADLVKAFSALRSGEIDAGRLDIQRRQTELKQATLDLDREKFEAAQRRAVQADEAEGVLRDTTLTPEDRERRYKEIFGVR